MVTAQHNRIYDVVLTVDCPMVAGADSVYGLLGDPCDCQNYYQCEYNTTTNAFIALQRACNPCEKWDQDVLTCVRDESKGDCTWAPTTAGIGENHSQVLFLDCVGNISRALINFLLTSTPLLCVYVMLSYNTSL